MSDIIYTFDRSTLERWATCPQQAWLMSRHKTPVGDIAEAGTQVHDAISRAIQGWIDARGMISPQDFTNSLELELLSSRPDVQPDVISAMRKSLWSFSRFITNEHYQNILRFDGGEADKSGQLSHDFDSLNCRVTAELDLILATPSKQEVDVFDWKSGWAHWTASQVKKSFQFQMQSWLVLENYPNVECVRVTIWNLRENRRTYSVEFFRSDMPAIDARVRHAAGLAVRYGQTAFAPEGWPTTEKCDLCSVAAMCDVGSLEICEIDPPEVWVDRLVALYAKSTAIEKSLAKIVSDRKSDIETESGNCFGFGKPKRAIKPKAASYSKTAVVTSSEESE